MNVPIPNVFPVLRRGQIRETGKCARLSFSLTLSIIYLFQCTEQLGVPLASLNAPHGSPPTAPCTTPTAMPLQTPTYIYTSTYVYI